MFDSVTMDMLEVEAMFADLGPGDNLLSLTGGHLGKPRAARRKRTIMILIQLSTISIFLEDLTNPAFLIAMNPTKEGSNVSFLLLLVSTSCINICVETLCLLPEVHNVAVDGGNLLLGPAGELDEVLVDAPGEEVLEATEDCVVVDLTIVVFRLLCQLR